ncbi:MAG: N-6 DNA methylase [Candidatus Stahlbacteria bacterium]|nr:N-6 DNA methylase [Candidatus Stahlbacteria bacterium]
MKNRQKFDSDEFTDLYEDMLKLFHLINNGNKKCDIPQYNGGLFDPEKHPELENWQIGEKTLANVLRRLIAANIPKGIGEQDSFDFGDTVDYADLEVRQLGSIYEGLLENQLEQCHSEQSEESLPCVPGTLVLKGDKTERKATGTYYTPDDIVQYIVDNTLGPLCKEIEKLPEVQARGENSFAKAVLKLKVLDPSMGSGHFLVRATEVLAEQIVYHPTTVLQNIKVPRGLSQDEEEFAYWRRKVVESCIYGVDLNPLAVELAKLSLWLTCIASDKPLSFLDHHIRPGNSLIGAKINELGNLPTKKKFPLLAPDLKKAVSNAIQKLKTIEEIESKNIDVIKKKENYWQEVSEELKPYREVADLWTATLFGIKIDETEYQNLAKLLISNTKPYTKVGATLAVAQTEGQGQALPLQKKWEPYIGFQEIAKNKMFFHWELEFPEVFFNEDGTRKENPGFNAVIANPPYGAEIGTDIRKRFRVATKEYRPEISRNCYNSEGIFIERGIILLQQGGTLTYIVPNNIARGSSFEKIRALLLEETNIKIIVDEGNPFENVTLEMLIILIQRENATTSNKINVISRRKGFDNFYNTVDQKIFLKYRRLILYYDKLFEMLVKDSLIDIITTSGNLVIGSKYLIQEKKPNLLPVITGRSAYRYVIRQDGLEYVEKNSLDERHLEILGKELLATTLHINKFRVIIKPCGYTLGESSVYLIFDEGLFNPRFIMSILNSRLINFYVKRYIFNNSFLTFDLTSPHTKFVPIKKLAFPQQKPFIELVDRILAITKDDDYLNNSEKQAQVKTLEQEIDRLVYKLYGLTEEEIKIVEGKNNFLS